MYSPFWYKQIDILYNKNHIFEIFPSRKYDIVRKLNAVMRFSIYYTILVFLYKRNSNILAVPVITGIITYFIWSKNTSIQHEELKNNLMNDKNKEVVNQPVLEHHNDKCNLPTKNNPFMNPSFTNVSSDKPLPKACTSYENKGIQRQIEHNFNDGLYRNYNDIFGKENSQRQFYTVAGREGIPDQSSFAHWLYRSPSTCKEGNGIACITGPYGNNSLG